MATFTVTARKTSPITPVTVEADSREIAIQQVVDQVAEGEQIEVLQCVEEVSDTPPGATGATGATGTATRSHSKKD
jgi:hypothetical protein